MDSDWPDQGSLLGTKLVSHKATESKCLIKLWGNLDKEKG